MAGGSKKGQRGTPRRQVYRVGKGGVYQDIPLEAYGQTANYNAVIWLQALDLLIPPTTGLTYAQLFAIIGPAGETPADIAAQNRRVAQLLGYDLSNPLARSAGMRFVQRYRASERAGSNRKNVRGVSAASRQQLLSDVAPTARDLMLRRYMTLTTRYGLFGHFRGWMKIYLRLHRYDRDGGVRGDGMALVRQSANQNDWGGAAGEYLIQWLMDWGPEFEDNALFDETEVIVGPDGEQSTWVLRLGYPNDIGLPRNSPQLLNLLEDEALGAYTEV